jgi:hypothetical protein
MEARTGPKSIIGSGKLNDLIGKISRVNWVVFLMTAKFNRRGFARVRRELGGWVAVSGGG